jgi:hypothetical protein
MSTMCNSYAPCISPALFFSFQTYRFLFCSFLMLWSSKKDEGCSKEPSSSLVVSFPYFLLTSSCYLTVIIVFSWFSGNGYLPFGEILSVLKQDLPPRLLTYFSVSILRLPFCRFSLSFFHHRSLSTPSLDE